MNRNLILIPFLIFYSRVTDGQVLNSQDTIEKQHKSIIKLEIVFGGIQYEHRIAKKSSFQISIQYAYKGLNNKDEYDFQFTPEYRLYLTQKKGWADGFYLGSYLFYKDYVVARDMESNGSNIYSKDLVKTAGVGLKSGYSLKIADRIPIDFTIGFGYNLFCDVIHKQGVVMIDESSDYVNFTGGISFGYIF
jgi:hypothetical protein